jgi:hypothetical protein
MTRGNMTAYKPKAHPPSQRDKPQKLADARRANERSNEFHYEHPERMPHSKSFPYRSPGGIRSFGMLWVALLMGQFVIEAQAEIQLRGARAIGPSGAWQGGASGGRSAEDEGVRPSAYSKNATTDLALQEHFEKGAMESAPLQLRPFRYAGGSHGRERPSGQLPPLRSPRSAGTAGRAAPSTGSAEDVRVTTICSSTDEPSLLTGAINKMPQRATHAARILTRNGLDPHKVYRVQENFLGAVIDAEYPLVALYLDRYRTQFPASRTSPPELDGLPDPDSVFDQQFKWHKQHEQYAIANGVREALAEQGFTNLDADASTLEVVAVYHDPDNGGHLADVGHLGQILKITEGSVVRHYAIVPVNCDAVISIPEDEAERNEWLKLNRHLFFSDPNRDGIRAAGYSLRTVLKDLTADDAVDEIATRIVDLTLDALRPIAYDETEFESQIHTARGFLVPLYDTVRYVRAGDYEVAALSALLDLYSLAPSVVSAVRHTHRAVRWWLRRAANFIPPHPEKAAVSSGARALIAKRAKASAGVGESVRTFGKAGATADSAAVQEGLRELRRFVDDNSAQLQQFIDRPLEQCEAAMSKLFELMGPRYGKRIHARGMYIFDHKGDFLPTNHFAVRVRIGQTDYIVDLTAGQFKNQPRGMKIGGPIIDTEQAWAQKYRDAAGGRLIKYDDFEHASAARNTFTSQAQIDPADVIPGAKILNQPDWHKGLKPIMTKPRYRPRKGRRYHVRGHRNRP